MVITIHLQSVFWLPDWRIILEMSHCDCYACEISILHNLSSKKMEGGGVSSFAKSCCLQVQDHNFVLIVQWTSHFLPQGLLNKAITILPLISEMPCPGAAGSWTICLLILSNLLSTLRHFFCCSSSFLSPRPTDLSPPRTPINMRTNVHPDALKF